MSTKTASRTISCKALVGLTFLWLVMLGLVAASPLHAADMTVAWDPSPDPRVTGYKLYLGETSGRYSEVLDVGNQTQYTLVGLEPGQLVYLAATAYREDGLESAFSDEIICRAPEPQPPVADAGPDQNVNEGGVVTLSAANSTDADDGIVSYHWEQTAGPWVDLSDADGVTASFVAPEVDPEGASLAFRVTVTDAGGLTSSDTCTVNVIWVNQPPVADAGADQSVRAGEAVVLDGTRSSDPDDGIAIYLWEQVEGPPVTLSDPTAAQPGFTAPQVGPEGASLTFKLTVEDQGGLSAEDLCVVIVEAVNAPPTADAGMDQRVEEGTWVTLDGSGSSDPDDGIISYRWSQTAGIPVSLSGVDAPRASFQAPSNLGRTERLTFELAVTDRSGLVSRDSCVVEIIGSVVYEDAEDGSTSGWFVYDAKPNGAKVNNIYDPERQSRVIELSGAGTKNGYRFSNDPGNMWAAWNDTSHFVIQWSMRFSENFRIYVDVNTTAGQRFIYYSPVDGDYLGNGRYVHHGLGTLATDGQWRTIVRDLLADLQDAQPGVRILSVNGFLVKGSGRIDDLILRGQ